MSRQRPPAVAAAGAVIVAIACFLAWRKNANEAELHRLEAAAKAVVLDVPAPVVDLFPKDGVPVPLAKYRGRHVFVNFWATWCGPCVAEMPTLVALSRRVDPADLAFVSIAEDDSWPPLDAWLARNPLPFDVYRDQPPRVEDRFETKSYPTSFLLGPDGRALYRFNGARDWDSAEVRALLAFHGIDVTGP